jgi:hypothetical protein
MTGPIKLLVIALFAATVIGLLPLVVWPLPYEGMDWVQMGHLIYYPTEEPAPGVAPTPIYLPLVFDRR